MFKSRGKMSRSVVSDSDCDECQLIVSDDQLMMAVWLRFKAQAKMGAFVIKVVLHVVLLFDDQYIGHIYKLVNH